MKRCPHCAGEIQDEAVVCRHCRRWLTVPHASPVPGPPVASRPPQTNSMAVVSLVFGILGLVWLVGIGPLLALFFGYQARRRIQGSGGRESGGGLALAGIILGWLGVVAACALIGLAFHV